MSRRWMEGSGILKKTKRRMGRSRWLLAVNQGSNSELKLNKLLEGGDSQRDIT